MSNLGDSNTPIEGQSFGLPAGAELGEDNGDVVIKDSSGTIILRRNETASEWQFEGTDLTGINSIDASSATFENASLTNGTITSEATEPDEIPRLDQLSGGGVNNTVSQSQPPVGKEGDFWTRLGSGWDVYLSQYSPGGVWQGPDEDSVITSDRSGTYLLNAVTGETIFTASEEQIERSFIGVDGGYWVVDMESGPEFIEYDPQTGNVIQSDTMGADNAEYIWSELPNSAYAVEGLNQFGYGDIYSYDVASLSQNWSQQIDGPDSAWCVPAVSDTQFFVSMESYTSNDDPYHKLKAYDKSTGSLNWTLEVNSSNTSKFRVNGVFNGNVWVGEDDGLQAYAESDQSEQFLIPNANGVKGETAEGVWVEADYFEVRDPSDGSLIDTDQSFSYVQNIKKRNGYWYMQDGDTIYKYNPDAREILWSYNHTDLEGYDVAGNNVVASYGTSSASAVGFSDVTGSQESFGIAVSDGNSWRQLL